MMEPRKVIIKPLITEKGTHLTENYRVYPFQVSKRANKREIKNAIESIYGVTVTGVRTMNAKDAQGAVPLGTKARLEEGAGDAGRRRHDRDNLRITNDEEM